MFILNNIHIIMIIIDTIMMEDLSLNKDLTEKEYINILYNHKERD